MCKILAAILALLRGSINVCACASPRLEQLPTSKYFFCLGDHASTSQDFTFRSARSPEQHSRVRTGISMATEQINRVLPQLVEPHLGLFRLADNDHLLLLKLVDTIHAALLDAVRALLLTEAWRIAGERSTEASSSSNDRIDELTDHGVLGLVPIRYRSSPSILYIMASISAKLITPVTTLLRIINGGTQ